MQEKMSSNETEAFGFTLIIGGKRVIIPPAIEHWKQSTVAKEILWKGEVENYGLFNMLQGNIAIILLTTGFENYCKIRYFELEKNGLVPDIDAILSLCYSRKDIENNIKTTLQERARINNISIIQQLSKERRLNFQNYKESSRSFFKGFGIKFDELENISSQDIQKIKKMINYRHRLIHVDPMITMLNQLQVPPETPVFISKEIADDTESLFSKFINSLHSKTTDLINSQP